MSRRAPNIFQRTYCDLVEGSALSTLTGSSFKHAQRDTVGHVRQAGAAIDVTLKSDRVSNQRASRSDRPSRLAELAGHTLGKRDSGYTAGFGTIYPAGTPLQELILQYEGRNLGRLAAIEKS